MLLKFIGNDGSMGLKHGKVYSVSIESDATYIWLRINGAKGACPYISPKALAENWEHPITRR